MTGRFRLHLSCFLFSFILTPLSLGLDADLTDLHLVHVVYRHGDRNPIDMYPTDPYKDPSYWPEGFGQLTNRGKRRHFALGQWLRKRYDGFLSAEYIPDEIYVRSTDVDRTLMSAESNLAGLYPPTKNNQWNTNIGWQPIPVHTVPQTEDALLSSHAECPRYFELQDELLKSQNFSDIYEENRKLFEYISANAGANVTNVVELDYIYDTLYIEFLNNLTLPNWTAQVFPGGKFKELVDFSFIVDTYTPELRRLKGGPFVKELVSHWDQVKEGRQDPADRKLYMYSGHDTSVAPILNTLDLFSPPIAPPYAAMIIFELFKTDNNYHISISYKNETDREPYKLTIPGCTQRCELGKFKELVEPMIPGNWRLECGIEDHHVTGAEDKIILIAALVSSVMAAIVLLATCSLVCRGKKKDSDVRYQRVDME